jgi:hypothetical protein
MSADGLSVGRAAATSRTQLRLPDRLPQAEWVRIGQHICLIADASSWWLGDWLVYGQDKFPDRYRRAMAGTALDCPVCVTATLLDGLVLARSARNHSIGQDAHRIHTRPRHRPRPPGVGRRHTGRDHFRPASRG